MPEAITSNTNNWHLVNYGEDYIDYERELISFEDYGNSSVDMRLSFDVAMHSALIIMLRKNDDGNTLELGDPVNVAWDEGYRLIHSSLDSRYAESIIGNRANEFNALEIQGVRDLNNPGDPQGTFCEVNNENPQFYSVYAHLVPSGDNGGIECVGDFATHHLAAEYARDLAGKFGWPVHDYSEA